jgi:membrane protein involved in colicin uptake
MPEETQTEQQVNEQQQDAQTAPEADGAEEEPFDRKRAEAALRKKNSEAENLRKRLKELEPLAAKAKELEDAQKSESERLSEQLTAQRERAEKAVRAAVASKVEALAAKQFADPEDAVGALDLTAYVDENGAIDADQIRADLNDLLKRKPHWAIADDSGPRRPAPDRTQGSSGNGNRTPNSPADEFAGFMKRALNGGR